MKSVKAAWSFVVESYPEVVRPLPKIRSASLPRSEIECLDVKEVEVLLDWLRGNELGLWANASLQALAGLRILHVALYPVASISSLLVLEMGLP